MTLEKNHFAINLVIQLIIICILMLEPSHLRKITGTWLLPRKPNLRPIPPIKVNLSPNEFNHGITELHLRHLDFLSSKVPRNVALSADNGGCPWGHQHITWTDFGIFILTCIKLLFESAGVIRVFDDRPTFLSLPFNSISFAAVVWLVKLHGETCLRSFLVSLHDKGYGGWSHFLDVHPDWTMLVKDVKITMDWASHSVSIWPVFSKFDGDCGWGSKFILLVNTNVWRKVYDS